MSVREVCAKIYMMMVLFFLPRKPKLTSEEILRLANILDNAGQVFLGVMVLAPLVAGVDRRGQLMVSMGLIFTTLSWFFSWWLTRKAGEL